MTYLKAILIVLDQLLNTIFCGWPDETLSSRAWRWHVKRVRSWPMRCINTLFFWQANHCKSSYESERLRSHLPPGLRS